LHPNVIDSGNTDKERQKIQPKRQLLSGSVDQVGKDLQEIQQMGVDHFILNYNRSVISDNTDKIIEVSKQLSSGVPIEAILVLFAAFVLGAIQSLVNLLL